MTSLALEVFPAAFLGEDFSWLLTNSLGFLSFRIILKVSLLHFFCRSDLFYGILACMKLFCRSLSSANLIHSRKFIFGVISPLIKPHNVWLGKAVCRWKLEDELLQEAGRRDCRHVGQRTDLLESRWKNLRIFFFSWKNSISKSKTISKRFQNESKMIPEQFPNKFKTNSKRIPDVNCVVVNFVVEVVIAPPAIYLDYVKSKVPAGIKVAAQNCSKEASGAFTGEIRYFFL